MTKYTPFIIRQDEARVFHEGPEICREYFRNEAMWFGSSVLGPGDTGAVDPGHEGAWEIFYCVSGVGVLDDGTNEYPLAEGDVLAFPPSVPHRIHNRSSEPVVMVWAGGPGTAAEQYAGSAPDHD